MKKIFSTILFLFLAGCSGGGASINYHHGDWAKVPVLKGAFANLEYDHHDLQKHIEYDKALGVSIVNAGLPWFVLEPEQGKIDLSWTKEYVKAYKQAGIDIIMCISSAPKWVNGSDDPFYIPQDELRFVEYLQKYKAFVRYVVGQLKNDVHIYRIGNEVNMKRFFSSMSSTQYCRFANAVYEAIMEADPSATVLWGSGITSWSREDTDRKLGTKFFKEIVACAPVSVDNFDIHSYGKDEAMMARNILDKAGRKLAKIWITEFGFPTNNDIEQLAWYKYVLNKIKEYGLGVAEMTAFIDVQWPEDMIDSGNTNPNIKPYGLVKVNEDGSFVLRPAAEFYRDYKFE